jgi:hypothetical protein
MGCHAAFRGVSGWRIGREKVSQRSQGLAELRLSVDRDSEVPVADQLAPVTQPTIARDQRGQGRVGTLHQPDDAQVAQPPRLV